jgi:hypothetical protein
MTVSGLANRDLADPSRGSFVAQAINFGTLKAGDAARPEDEGGNIAKVVVFVDRHRVWPGGSGS